MRKLAAVLILMTALLPFAAAALPPTEAMLAERALGDPQAKVTIVEYSSLTCPHCAEFHQNVLPQIKAEYIDTGMVRWVFRDFPLDGRAMGAAMIARCVPAERYFGFIDMLFRDQQAWARSTDPLTDLKVRAQLAGLAPADVDACLADKVLLQGIQTRAQEAQKQDGIDGTPSFRMNGQKIAPNHSFDEFKSVITPALGK